MIIKCAQRIFKYNYFPEILTFIKCDSLKYLYNLNLKIF